MQSEFWQSGFWQSDFWGPAMWWLAVVGGPVLLGSAIAIGLLATWRKRSSPADVARTERATRDLYRRNTGDNDDVHR